MRKFATLAVAFLTGLALLFCLAAVPLQTTPAPLPVLGQALPATSGQALTGRHQLQQAGVQVRQYQSARGVEVRAYAAQGAVFGLAWQGVTAPNLPQLLGAHYQAYRKALASRRHRGPITVTSGNLVVQLSGHMRDLRGRAYLINAIPVRLSPAVIR